MRFNQLKKLTLFFASITSLNLFSITNVYAQDGTAYLKLIAENTLIMVQDLNNLPSYLQSIGQLVQAWLNPDTSEATATIQGGFTQLGNLFTQDLSTQLSLQTNLNTDLLNNDGNNVFNANNNTPPTSSGTANSTSLWYANDLVYSSLLGTYFFNDDPRIKGGQDKKKEQARITAYNYIKNASGLNIFHPIPGSTWGGSVAAKQRYQGFYNTVVAVSSYNAYVLSNQYADGPNFNTLQTTLIKQASDPQNWFAQVASENIGFVLRQVLLYESQTFILLTQMLQLQKQAVTAQVMTNAVLIANNLMNENVMIANAKGIPPSL